MKSWRKQDACTRGHVQKPRDRPVPEPGEGAGAGGARAGGLVGMSREQRLRTQGGGSWQPRAWRLHPSGMPRAARLWVHQPLAVLWGRCSNHESMWHTGQDHSSDLTEDPWLRDQGHDLENMGLPRPLP